MHNRQQRSGDGRLAAGKRECCRAAIKGRETFFKDVSRRVHQAGVDVAEFSQAEQIGGVVGVFEHVARRRINRDGARGGCGVGNLPSM